MLLLPDCNLERTSPQLPAQDALTPLQIKVLTAKTPKVPKTPTVAWAVKAIARLVDVREKSRFSRDANENTIQQLLI